MRTWLDNFDNPDWQSEAHHDDALVPLLDELRHLLRVQRHLEALEKGLQLLHRTMSDRQQALLLRIVAQAAMEAGEYPVVEGALERALSLAVVQSDRGATAQLLTLRAQGLRNDGRYTEALLAYTRCLDLLHEIGRRTLRRARGAVRSADVEREFATLSGLAIIHFSRGRHELCEALLDRADALLTSTPATGALRPELGQILWLKALNARWMNQPWRALDLVEAAITIFKGTRSTATVGRVFAVSAEIALDCLHSPEREPAYRLRHGEMGLLATAERHAQLSFELCRKAGDPPGQELAKLAVVRHSRMTGRNENRVPVLEGAAEFASACGDAPLLIQVCSALADELVMLGQPAGALNLYRHTVHLAEESEMPVMGRWAHFALLGMHEAQP